MLIGLVGVVSLIWPIMIQSAVAARSGFLSSPGTMNRPGFRGGPLV
jgi:hypothetical protein